MSTNEPVDTIEYKGYRIKIYYDVCPANPWEDWDFELPIIAESNGDIQTYGIDLYPPLLERKEIIDNLPTILNILGYDTKFAMVRDLGADYLENRIYDALCEAAEGDLEAIAELHRMKKDTYVYEAPSYGYCQGDYAELAVIVTPEWRSKAGASKEDDRKNAEAAVKLWSAWAWGDVYGYVVEDENGKTYDSCWGYYGDPITSGLMDNACSYIDVLASAKASLMAACI